MYATWPTELMTFGSCLFYYVSLYALNIVRSRQFSRRNGWIMQNYSVSLVYHLGMRLVT